MKTNKLKTSGKTYLFMALALLIGFFIARGIYTPAADQDSEVSQSHAEEEIWTCSMHPQIRQDHPGTCPICGMDLIPLEKSSDSDSHDNLVSLTSTEMRRAGVRTIEIGSAENSSDIYLSGRVALNPKAVFAQTAHVSGRLEELTATDIGEHIEKGQKIGAIYSPELYNAQKELLHAYKNRETHPAIYQAVREKIKLWKIKDWEIDRIIKSGKAIEDFPIYADYSGYLLSREIEPGEHVEDGSELFTLSQMDKLWGVFNVYEKNMPFVKKGMKIDYSLNALPGKTFETTIDFVEPVLNAETRTAKARILIPNPDFELKPEMFLNAVIHAEDPDMESEITIPKSAVMWTGRKSVVYVEKESDHGQSFEMRKVTLGASTGNSYRLKSGLKVGDRIVVEGTFSVDAAAQLRGVAGMMSLSDDTKSIQLTKEQKELFDQLFEYYFQVKNALVEDDYETAKKEFEQLIELQAQIPEAGEFAALIKEWNHFTDHLEHMPEMMETMESFREQVFEDLSALFISMAEEYDLIEYPAYVEHCPMAGEEGADWLSRSSEILNPYYGEEMLDCGEVVRKLN